MQKVDDVLKQFGLSRIRQAPDEVEEALYGIAAMELEQEEHSPGLMAKAFSESEGDENKAKALYLKLRVSQLQRQLQQLTQSQRQLERQQAEQERRRFIEEREAERERFANLPPTEGRGTDLAGIYVVVFAFLVVVLLIGYFG